MQRIVPCTNDELIAASEAIRYSKELNGEPVELDAHYGAQDYLESISILITEDDKYTLYTGKDFDKSWTVAILKD